jgi:hypothetical protein
MPLKALTRARVRLLGWTDPRSYDAGTTEDGRSFPAGRSMQVCVAAEEHDFAVLKVKKESVDAIAGVAAQMTPGVEVDITFETTRHGQVLHSLGLPGK